MNFFEKAIVKKVAKINKGVSKINEKSITTFVDEIKKMKGYSMKELIAKCGCNCSRCPTYKNNLKTLEDRNRCSWGWQQYLNIKLSPEKLRLCDGCSIPDDRRNVYYLSCLVRKCAIKNGIENCAYCSGYPCQEVSNIHSQQKLDAKEKIIKRIGYEIPEQDYLAFIEPYEGIKHLNEIRQRLGNDEIIEMKCFSFHPKIVNFPKELPFSKDVISGYRSLHQILSSLEISDNVSYARQFILEKNRKHLLNILWAFGRLGELNRSYLMLDSETCSEQKISTYYSKIQEYFRLFENYGVNCGIIPLIATGWLTPTGGLRKRGWLMKLAFDEKMGGDLTLKALKNYALKLEAKYGKDAFRYFSKTDMRILSLK